jgi:hypothetical protein
MAESVTENLCAAVIAAGGIIEAYQDWPKELSDPIVDPIRKNWVANLWQMLCGSLEAIVLDGRFRGQYAGPPAPIAGVSAASYHELGLALAAEVYHGIAVGMEMQEVWSKGGGKGDVPVTGVKEYLRQRAPRFDSGRLVALIRDEAARAERMHGKPAAATPSDPEPAAKLSPSDLARKHGVSGEALRKRLDRWRYEHDAGYHEVANPKRNEPKYLYDESAVMPVIDALKANLLDKNGQQTGSGKKSRGV